MSNTKLERIVEKEEEELEKMEMEFEQKKKEVEETRQVLELREKLYARLRKQKEEKRRLRIGLNELDKENAELDERASQVRRCILKHLSITALFTKYNIVS